MSKYKLELSKNAGISYDIVEESDTLCLLDSFCKEFDKKGWRWVITNSCGKTVRYCTIHKNIANMFGSSCTRLVNSKEKK